MAIRQISLNDFRNLRSTTLDLHEHLNIITGINASGKTSFLEALHIICQGRSFKTHQINHCIQNNKNSFLLFSLFDDYKAGITRDNNTTVIRIDNETIHRVSLLTKKTPIRILNSSSFDLILGPPVHKRKFIDWCLFHVEQDYQSLWVDHRHALKQRNALLKKKKNLNELDYWDSYISTLCTKIYKLRFKYIESIQAIFNKEFSEVLMETPIELVYEPGWNVNDTLINNLNKNRKNDIKYGFTRYGIHRDDIKILTNGILIQQVFSRGQIKKISLLLYISQLFLIKKLTNKEIILLIDDLDSELDKFSVEYILKILSNLNIQLFITTIDKASDMLKKHEEYKLFHVEHGMIKAVKHTREHNVRI